MITPHTHMLRKHPANINIVPLQPNSSMNSFVKGANTIVPTPVPLAAKPRAIALFFSNQNAIETTAVTKVRALPINIKKYA